LLRRAVMKKLRRSKLALGKKTLLSLTQLAGGRLEVYDDEPPPPPGGQDHDASSGTGLRTKMTSANGCT
jgi:hypothetical protein